MRGATRLPTLLIDIPTCKRLALRALALWLVTRITFTLMSALLAGAIGGPIIVGTGAAPSVIVVLVTTLLSDIDVRLTREALFLAHIGFGRRHIAALTAIVAGVAETAFRVVLAVAFA